MSLPPELFPERPVRSDINPPGRKRRVITIALLAVVVASGVYWKFGGSTPTNPEDIPTITAESDWKQKPEEPGGIDIPHQDVQVYQSLDGASPAKPAVEHLLPPPEAPQAGAAPTAPADTASAAPAPGQIETLPPATVTEAPTPSPAPVAAAPEPAPAPAAAPAPAKTAAKGKHKIQLASLAEQAAAQKTMGQMQKKYAAILGETKLQVIRADLGGKGVYYRVQSAGLTETHASSLCAALKKAKASCFLVRP
ncbi:MAG: SPOR domain-containing protein [Alphaproteobacteria bacterium]|nr:SPOR domain-containing protein [Alphaproteobacteria bacterium]